MAKEIKINDIRGFFGGPKAVSTVQAVRKYLNHVRRAMAACFSMA